jgi:hypothetical protein
MNVPADGQKPEIIEEEDKPFSNGNNAETELSEKQIEILQKKVKIAGDMQSIGLRDRAFTLLKWCIITLFSLVVIDCLMINFHLKSSTLLNGSFDFLKYIVSALVGFVFAVKAPDK